MLHSKVNSKSKFNDFGTQKWVQKSIKNQPRRQKAAQTPPGHPQESPQRLPRSHFGNFLTPFWIICGAFLSQFSELKRSQSKRLEETREDTFPRSQDASKPPRFETIRGRRHGGGALKISNPGSTYVITTMHFHHRSIPEKAYRTNATEPETLGQQRTLNGKIGSDQN